MITSVIGKIFLTAYNSKYGTNYDAKAFFVEVFYPLFFDHPKYMMTAGNSPLENPKIKWSSMLNGNIPYETSNQRKERFDNLINKIENHEPDMSIALGYPSIDPMAKTSGQVSNIKLGTTTEDVYLSWIGGGLGVGVQGGMSILFNRSEILLDIYEGWNLYREALNQTPQLKGMKIETWNGQWLSHKYKKRGYMPSSPMANLNPFSTKDGTISIDTQSWIKVLIGISRTFTSPQLMGYVYKYGKTNTTVGFIPFALSQINRALDLYQKFFGMDSGEKAEQLYGTAFGFTKACQAGVIGIKAMEPKGLKEYIEKGKIPKSKDNEEEQIKFSTYQIWILAMLNNEELWAKAQDFAKALHAYSQASRNARTDRSNQVKSILSATSKKGFIESLVDIVGVAENQETITETASIVNLMSSDNVPYFLTLIRFHFAATSK